MRGATATLAPRVVRRITATTLRELERPEFEEVIDGNTVKMKAAEVLGFVSELRDHYPGYALWSVPRPLIEQLGYVTAVVRA